MDILDLIILIIIAYSAWKGLRLGLVASLTGLFAWLAAFVLAARCYYPVSLYLNRYWHLNEVLNRFFARNFHYVPQPGIKAVLFFPEYGKVLPALKNIDIAGSTVELISFLLILIVVQLAVRMAGRILSSFMSLTPLVVLDRLGGLVFGVFWGILWVLVLTAVFSYLIPLFSLLVPPAMTGLLATSLHNSMLIPYFKSLTQMVHLHWPLLPL